MKVIKKGKKIKKNKNSVVNFKPKKQKNKPNNRSKDEILTGVVSVNPIGYGFLKVEGYSSDFFIPKRKMLDAFNGDTVLAKRVPNSPKGDEVEVVKVLERGLNQTTGVFFRDKYGSFVRPDDNGFIYDIKIKNAPNDIREYQKVFVKITSFPQGKNPEGIIVKVLGDGGELFCEEECILINKDIDTKFWENTISEAKSISGEVNRDELKDRLDLTKELIFTIDGEYSRDFDDAVSLKINEKGNYVLGVHIADVSHYVLPKTALDKQAFLRGNSTYLPDKVIPMLPFELSNGICSLNQGVLRLTLSVIAEIDPFGKTLSVKFYKSYIKSSYRLTYNIVQDIIDDKTETVNSYNDIVPTIKNMNKLKDILLNRRNDLGQIDLSIRESDVFYNNGKITISEHKANDATMLIEQFMIFANLCVGEYLTKKQAPTLYRVHEKPTDEKIAGFNAFLDTLGKTCKVTENTPKSFKKVLDSLRGESCFDVVNKVMLRSMQKAKYSTENLGHFGLGAMSYLHFTSPIRRYPDLVVHRVLKSIIENKNAEIIDSYRDFCEKSAQNCSLCERKSMEAERDIDSLYKAFYMKDYVGQEFDGVISGVTNFGVFVELDNLIEGLVRMEYLPGGNYEYMEKSLELKGRRQSFKLGDRVHVGVLGVNLGSRRPEFIMLKKIHSNIAK